MPDTATDPQVDETKQAAYEELRRRGAFNNDPVKAAAAQELVKRGALRDVSGGSTYAPPAPAVPFVAKAPTNMHKGTPQGNLGATTGDVGNTNLLGDIVKFLTPGSNGTVLAGPPSPQGQRNLDSLNKAITAPRRPGNIGVLAGPASPQGARNQAAIERAAKDLAAPLPPNKTGNPNYNPGMARATRNPITAPVMQAADTIYNLPRVVNAGVDRATGYPAAAVKDITERSPFDPNSYDKDGNLLTTPSTTSAPRAFAGGARGAIGPAIAGLKGATAGAEAGSEFGPWGSTIGGIGGAFASTGAANWLQDQLTKAALGPDLYAVTRQQQGQDVQQHPIASLAGEMAPMPFLFKPDLPTILKPSVGRGIGAGIGVAQEAYNQIQQGKFDPLKLGVAGGAGWAYAGGETPFGESIAEGPRAAGAKVAEGIHGVRENIAGRMSAGVKPTIPAPPPSPFDVPADTPIPTDINHESALRPIVGHKYDALQHAVHTIATSDPASPEHANAAQSFHGIVKDLTPEQQASVIGAYHNNGSPILSPYDPTAGTVPPTDQPTTSEPPAPDSTVPVQAQEAATASNTPPAVNPYEIEPAEAPTLPDKQVQPSPSTMAPHSRIITNRAELSDALQSMAGFKYPKQQADDAATHWESVAQGVTKQNGGTVADWYKQNAGRITNGGADMARRLTVELGDDPETGKPYKLTDKNAMLARTGFWKTNDDGTVSFDRDFRFTPQNARRLLIALRGTNATDPRAGSNESTSIHELGHVLRQSIVNPADRALLDKWAGVKNGEQWTPDNEDMFAQSFERWVRSGAVPHDSLRGVFGRFKTALGNIYKSITDIGATKAFSPKIIDMLAKYHGDVSDVTGEGGRNPFAREVGSDGVNSGDERASVRGDDLRPAQPGRTGRDTSAGSQVEGDANGPQAAVHAGVRPVDRAGNGPEPVPEPAAATEPATTAAKSAKPEGVEGDPTDSDIRDEMKSGQGEISIDQLQHFLSDPTVGSPEMRTHVERLLKRYEDIRDELDKRGQLPKTPPRESPPKYNGKPIVDGKLSSRELSLVQGYIDGANKVAAGADPKTLQGFKYEPNRKYSAEASYGLDSTNPHIKIGKGWYDVGGGKETILHEVGHMLVDKIGESSKGLNDFFELAKKSADAPGLTNSGKWEIRGTRDSAVEWISQLYAEVMRDPDLIKEHFPDEYRWITDHADAAGFPIRKAGVPAPKVTPESTRDILEKESLTPQERASQILAAHGLPQDHPVRADLEYAVTKARERLDRGVENTFGKGGRGINPEEHILFFDPKTGHTRVQSQFDEQSTISPQQHPEYYPKLDPKKFTPQPDTKIKQQWQMSPEEAGREVWKAKQSPAYRAVDTMTTDAKKMNAEDFKAKYPKQASKTAGAREAASILAKTPEPSPKELATLANADGRILKHRDAVNQAVEKGWTVAPKAASPYPEARAKLQRVYDINVYDGTSNDPDHLTHLNGNEGDTSFYGPDHPLKKNGINVSLKNAGITDLRVGSKQFEGARELLRRDPKLGVDLGRVNDFLFQAGKDDKTAGESFRDKQTASPEFKKWFGDWQGDPKNASKVVDTDGKPLVMYHFTANPWGDSIPRMNAGRGGAIFLSTDPAKSMAGAEAAGREMHSVGSAPTTMPFYVNSKRLYGENPSLGGFEDEIPVGKTIRGKTDAELDADGGDALERIKQKIDKRKWSDDPRVNNFAKQIARDQVRDYYEWQDLGTKDGVDSYKLIQKTAPKTAMGWEILEKGPSYSDTRGSKVGANALEALGFDGAYVSDEGATGGARTVAVFSPNQIKSAIGNRGTFDANDNNILFQTGKDDQTAIEPPKGHGSYSNARGELWVGKDGAEPAGYVRDTLKGYAPKTSSKPLPVFDYEKTKGGSWEIFNTKTGQTHSFVRSEESAKARIEKLENPTIDLDKADEDTKYKSGTRGVRTDEYGQKQPFVADKTGRMIAAPKSGADNETFMRRRFEGIEEDNQKPKDIARGQSALIGRVNFEKRVKGLDPDIADAAIDFIKSIPSKYTERLGMSVYGGHSVPNIESDRALGSYNPTDAIAAFANLGVSNSSVGERVLPHELSHHLEQFVPENDYRALQMQFKREQSAKQGPNEARADSLMRQTESAKRAGRDAEAEELSDKAGMARQHGYRYTNFQEWFAENIVDKAMRDMFPPESAGTRKLYQRVAEHLKGLLSSVHDWLIRRGQPDMAEAVYKRFMGGEYDATKQRNFGEGNLPMEDKTGPLFQTGKDEEPIELGDSYTDGTGKKWTVSGKTAIINGKESNNYLSIHDGQGNSKSITPQMFNRIKSNSASPEPTNTAKSFGDSPFDATPDQTFKREPKTLPPSTVEGAKPLAGTLKAEQMANGAAMPKPEPPTRSPFLHPDYVPPSKGAVKTIQEQAHADEQVAKVKQPFVGKAIQFLKETPSAMTSMVASGNLHFIGRHGAALLQNDLVSMRPGAGTARSIDALKQSLKSEAGADQMYKTQIVRSPHFKEAIDAGLKMNGILSRQAAARKAANAEAAGVDVVDQQDEYTNNWGHRLINHAPLGIGKANAAVERANLAYLDMMRFHAFETQMNALDMAEAEAKRDGTPFNRAEQATKIASHINALGGKGGLTKLGMTPNFARNVTKLLRVIAFSPTYGTSRVQMWADMADPALYKSQNKVARNYIIKTNLVHAAAIGGTMALVKALGGQIDDQGKVVIGNTHVDISAGAFRQAILMKRLVQNTGKPEQQLKIAAQYLRYGASPFAGLVSDQALPQLAPDRFKDPTAHALANEHTAQNVPLSDRARLLRDRAIASTAQMFWRDVYEYTKQETENKGEEFGIGSAKNVLTPSVIAKSAGAYIGVSGNEYADKKTGSAKSGDSDWLKSILK